MSDAFYGSRLGGGRNIEVSEIMVLRGKLKPVRENVPET